MLFLRSTLLGVAFVSSLLYQSFSPPAWVESEVSQRIMSKFLKRLSEHECMKYVVKRCDENVWRMDANSIFACQFDIAKELDKQHY